MLTIGRVAKKAGVSTDCVRFYERVGLLAATSKTRAGYRLYDDDCVRRLCFIKHAQRCGFSLPQIRELLQADTGGNRKAALRLALDKKREIEDTMTALRAMSEALSSYIRSCEASAQPPEEAAGEGILVSTLTAEVAAGKGERRGVSPERPGEPAGRGSVRMSVSSL